jgi:hypothetical protein
MRTIAVLLALAGSGGRLGVGGIRNWNGRRGPPASRWWSPSALATPRQRPPLPRCELSGVPMRQATVGLGAQRLAAATPVASVVNVSGVPLARAKQL